VNQCRGGRVLYRRTKRIGAYHEEGKPDVYDDIAALFYENVAASFTSHLECQRDGKAGRSRDLRSALAAATALYHFREHLPPAHSNSRADVGRQCPDYNLLGDVVNASKHKQITHGTPQLSSAEQIEERVVITEYQDQEGVYRHAEKQVILTLDDGTQRDLLGVMVNVINFWLTELVAIGIIPKRPAYVVPSDPQPRPRAACNGGRMDIEAIQGLRVKQTCCLQKYNYQTGQVEPVDLAGSKFEFRLIKPRFNVDAALKDEASGRKMSLLISLSDEESQELLQRPSDQEKMQYLQSLPQTKEAVQRLMTDAGLTGTQPPDPGSPS
jgi:hypothetical protein